MVYVRNATIGVDHEVAAELTGVLGGAMQSPARSHEPRVHAEGPDAVDAPPRTAPEIECSIEDPIRVGQDGERKREAIVILTEAFASGEGDHHHVGGPELVEVIAHGDHVFLAGQSGEMAVEDHDTRPTAMLR